MSLSDLQCLMQQVGPEMPEISTILQEESDRWQITFDEDASMEVVWQSDPPRVVFSCAVGEVPEQVRESVYARLLVANSLPSGQLGLRFALGVPDGQVLMIGEMNEADLSLDSLQIELDSFLRCAIELSLFIAESASNADEAVPDSAVLPELA